VEPLSIVLALAFGFVIGLIVGARRALNLVLSGRAVRTTGARLAHFMPPTVPIRSAEDILAGRVRIVLGGTTHNLPVLARGPSKRWLEQLDARFATLALSLDAARSNTPELMGLLVAETDALYEMLLSYDQTGVLPSRDEINETATDAQILHAVLEVWRAAHPLVDSVTASLDAETAGPSAAPSSSPPPPTDGPSSTSNPE
jgi:hypothetical protein